MRTTIDLPAELMRAAKIVAVERGISLKDLFTSALARELDRETPRPSAARLTFPLIGRPEVGDRVDVTNADIAAVFDAEDAEKYGR